MTVRRCTKCHKEKPVAEFNWRDKEKDTLQSHCKACKAEQRRRYRAENAEAVTEYKRRYRAENAEAIAERDRLYNASGECSDCGGPCDPRHGRCRSCADAAQPGVYNRTTIARREDRWSHWVYVYLRTVIFEGTEHFKIGVGSKSRRSEGPGEILYSFQAPLCAARYIELVIQNAAEPYSVPKDEWPPGLGGRTECVRDLHTAWSLMAYWNSQLDRALEDPDLFGLPLEEWLQDAA
jgi:post-segregation antitoxin (ccd killing protein)